MPTNPQWIEDRLRRAVRQVRKTYTISAIDEAANGSEHTRFVVANGRNGYEIAVSNNWRHPPSCTCPDMQRVGDDAGHGHCKHAIAVLLGSDAHRHQLIDLLL